MAKKRKYVKTNKIYHEDKLLPSRALIVVIHYMREYAPVAENDASLLQLLRDYRGKEEDIMDALKKAFRYMVRDRFEPDPDDPSDSHLREEKIPKEKILAAKDNVSRVLRSVWKKKPKKKRKTG